MMVIKKVVAGKHKREKRMNVTTNAKPKKMMGIQKVVDGSQDKKKEKKMNATTQAKTRNVYVRDIMMPVVFCKDCKYWQTSKIKGSMGYHTCMCVRFGKEGIIAFAEDFCSRGVKK